MNNEITETGLDQIETDPSKSRLWRLFKWLASFFVALALGYIFELILSKEARNQAIALQSNLITAVGNFSPEHLLYAISQGFNDSVNNPRAKGLEKIGFFVVYTFQNIYRGGFWIAGYIMAFISFYIFGRVYKIKISNIRNAFSTRGAGKVPSVKDALIEFVSSIISPGLRAGAAFISMTLILCVILTALKYVAIAAIFAFGGFVKLAGLISMTGAAFFVALKAVEKRTGEYTDSIIERLFSYILRVK